jgi:hypothetical protein
LGAGISITHVTPNFDRLDVRLKKRPWTGNYVGTQFGGSMFMMTDPFYMVMLINRLGPEYVVWDKAATIHYLKPGRTELRAEFRLDDTVLVDIRTAAAAGEKVNWNFTVDILGTDGVVVAKVEKVVYIRLKPSLAVAAV